MMPITNFLSCTDDSMSSSRCHRPSNITRKTYVTGLGAVSNKTMTGIAREVLPAKSKRALNKFLTEYDWDEE